VQTLFWPSAFLRDKNETMATLKIHLVLDELPTDLSMLQAESHLNKNILLEQIQCDFKIITSDDEEVRCHKVFLAARSLVFAKMFETDCQETLLNQVELPISKEGADAFLKFLYYTNVDAALNSPTVSLDLLELGHQYDIGPLEAAMKSILLSKCEAWFSLDNTFRLFDWGRKVREHASLKKKAMEMLKL